MMRYWRGAYDNLNHRNPFRQQQTFELELTEFEWHFLTALVDRFVSDYYATPRGGVQLEKILKLKRKLLDGTGFLDGSRLPPKWHSYFLGYWIFSSLIQIAPHFVSSPDFLASHWSQCVHPIVTIQDSRLSYQDPKNNKESQIIGNTPKRRDG